MFTLAGELSSIKKLSAGPQSQVMVLWAKGQQGKPWGKALLDKKSFIPWSLNLRGLNSDLVHWSPSKALTCSKAWICSEWDPDSQWCVRPIRVRGHPAANQARQVECGAAAPLVAVPSTSPSHTDCSLVCLFLPPCHTCPGTDSKAVCVERLSSALFFFFFLFFFVFRTSSTALPLALSNPLCPK